MLRVKLCCKYEVAQPQEEAVSTRREQILQLQILYHEAVELGALLRSMLLFPVGLMMLLTMTMGTVRHAMLRR